MTIMKEKIMKEKIILFLFLGGIFVFLYLFYTQMHPIIIKNADDWTYISTSRRSALPSLKEWNPAKIFPETIIPQIANIAVYVIYPVTNDYIGSFTIVFAIVLAGTITTYIFLFSRWIMDKFSLSIYQGVVCGILFFILHYLIFVGDGTDNLYLFMIYDINNFFNYSIPILLNLMLIFIIDRKPDMKTLQYYREHHLVGGLFVLLFYLAVFSNLFSSYLLAIYAGTCVLYDVIFVSRNIKGVGISKWIQQHFICFFILILWGVEAYFDGHGARAAWAKETNELPYINNIANTLLHLKEQLLQSNKTFLFIVTVSILLGGLLFITRSTNKFREITIKLSVGFLLAMVYIVLLAAKVQPLHVARMDVLIGPAALLFMWVLSTFADILRRRSRIVILVPLVCYILGCSIFCNTDGRVFYDIKNPQAYVELGNYYIEQFIAADQRMDTQFILDASSNAPHYLGDRIAMTLYKHGIVSRLMTVKTRKNPDVDALFDLR